MQYLVPQRVLKSGIVEACGIVQHVGGHCADGFPFDFSIRDSLSNASPTRPTLFERLQLKWKTEIIKTVNRSQSKMLQKTGRIQSTHYGKILPI
jgi:hypothetical protein